MISLGLDTFILSFNSPVQVFFKAQNMKQLKGCILSVTWGGSFKIVISSFLAFSDVIDACHACPS